MRTTEFCPCCAEKHACYESWVDGRRAVRCEACGFPIDVGVEAAAAVSFRRPKILYVDDDRLLLGLFAAAMETEGFQALVASDGPDGIAMAKRERPDLILLDVMMPKMDGFEVCRRVRTDPQLKDTPVVMITAMEDAQLASRGRQAGALLTMRKPFAPSVLLTTMNTALTRNSNGTARESNWLAVASAL